MNNFEDSSDALDLFSRDRRGHIQESELENKKWVELDWSGQRFYLPEYTALLRDIEQEVINTIESIGFQECLFPKLVTEDQFRELQGALPRFEGEGTQEAVHANCVGVKSFPKEFVHTHWQCEPFYYFLKEEKPEQPVMFFDRSGWSHRREQSIDDDRLFEFKRIECVWFAPEDESEHIQKKLLEKLSETFNQIGFPTNIIRKENEERATGEPAVYDIEVPTENFGDVEVTGTHYHGRLFLEAVNAEVDEEYQTGCCGIGISRLANLIFEPSKNLDE